MGGFYGLKKGRAFHLKKNGGLRSVIYALFCNYVPGKVGVNVVVGARDEQLHKSLHMQCGSAWVSMGQRGSASSAACGRDAQLHESLHIQFGINFFRLDSRRVLAPAPKVLESDIKTHLKSRFCLLAI